MSMTVRRAYRLVRRLRRHLTLRVLRRPCPAAILPGLRRQAVPVHPLPELTHRRELASLDLVIQAGDNLKRWTSSRPARRVPSPEPLSHALIGRRRPSAGSDPGRAANRRLKCRPLAPGRWIHVPASSFLGLFGVGPLPAIDTSRTPESGTPRGEVRAGRHRLHVVTADRRRGRSRLHLR
jgi:hypothetical protein